MELTISSFALKLQMLGCLSNYSLAPVRSNLALPTHKDKTLQEIHCSDPLISLVSSSTDTLETAYAA